jgi:hypothetical protein
MRPLGAFTQSRKALISFVCPCVLLNATISAALIGGISLKFDIGDIREGVKEIQIWSKSVKNIGHFT